jgi:hypothetical protein
VTRTPGSLFGYIVAVPVPIPVQKRARAGSGSALLDAGKSGCAVRAGASVDSKLDSDVGDIGVGENERMEAAGSRCGTPTFGSRVDLPSFEEAFARFGGVKGKRPSVRGGGGGDYGNVAKNAGKAPERSGGLGPALAVKKKIPSPLSIRPPPTPSTPQQTPTAPSSPTPLPARQLFSPTTPKSFRHQKQQPGGPTTRAQLALASPPQIKSPRRTLQSPPLSASPTPRLPLSPVSPVSTHRLQLLSRKLSSAALGTSPSPSAGVRRSGSRLQDDSMSGDGESLFTLSGDGDGGGGGEDDGKKRQGSVLAAAAKIELGLKSRGTG